MQMQVKGSPRMSYRAIAIGIAAAVLLVCGAWYAGRRSRPGSDIRAAPMSSMSGMAGPSASQPSTSTELQVDLAPDDLKKAQLHTAPVAFGSTALSLRTPGVVKANEYSEVHVTPLAGGVVREVPVVLGDHVRRGQPLAVIFSTELADAETAYISHSAEYETDHKKLQRTENLLRLGAASQQEEEEVVAAHAEHEARVQSSREKLQLLGATSMQIAALQQSGKVSANLVVPAPIRGIVLTRTANLGLVASPTQELFTIADLTKVWVIANINEQDFASVRLGSAASITAAAYPGRIWRGRVTYIQPQVDPATRTAQARIEVTNADEILRIEMYVDVDFATNLHQGLVVPQSAVQPMGDKEVVFVPIHNSEGSFAIRQVKTAPADVGQVAILAGVHAGDQVVTEGSFILRAEAARQHPELQ